MTINKTFLPDCIGSLKPLKSVRQVVHVSHVTLRTEIVVGALCALPSHADDAVPLASVAHDVVVLHTSCGVVENEQVVVTLVAYSVVAPGAVVPLNYNSFVGGFVSRIRRGRSVSERRWRLADFHNRPRVTLATVLVVPLPVVPANDPQSHLQHLRRLRLRAFLQLYNFNRYMLTTS